MISLFLEVTEQKPHVRCRVQERGFCSAVSSAQGSQPEEEEPVLKGGCGSSRPRTAQELGMLGLEKSKNWLREGFTGSSLALGRINF